MTNKTALIYISIVVILSVVVSELYNSIDLDMNKYISAQWGSKCYVMWYELSNIKYKKIHNNLSDCEDYIEIVPN
jgi:5-bromo-4-chloroindolyl phosphate hydrolysis protein